MARSPNEMSRGPHTSLEDLQGGNCHGVLAGRARVSIIFLLILLPHSCYPFHFVLYWALQTQQNI